jgi:hypothetical protein
MLLLILLGLWDQVFCLAVCNPTDSVQKGKPIRTDTLILAFPDKTVTSMAAPADL